MPKTYEVTVEPPADEFWKEFLIRRYKQDMARITREYPHSKSLNISYKHIIEATETGLRKADLIISDPQRIIGEINDTIRAHRLIRDKTTGEPPEHLQIRFTNLPHRTPVRELRSDDLRTMVSIEGVIQKVTSVRPRLTAAVFTCTSGHRTTVIQKYGDLQEPDRCSADGCTAKKFILDEQRSHYTDSQLVRIQESPESLKGGEQPQTLDVDMTHDLVGQLYPGDRIIINGVVKTFPRTSAGKKNTTYDMYVEANSFDISDREYDEITITPEDEDAIKTIAKNPEVYTTIIRSIAPSIYGSENAKAAIAYQLFGGVRKELPDSSHLRGDIHVLLIGDPGIAKSQILRYVTKISPRGIYANGQGASAAGLTAAAIRDDFDGAKWTVEAGALVLADKGVACVDEMDKMEKNDRKSLNSALEQQIVQINKAGLNVTLRSECALLAAANPKSGRFDDFTPFNEQIDMPPWLLSRFDLIFVLTDKPDKTTDKAIADHIVNTHRVGEILAKKNLKMKVSQKDLDERVKAVTPEIPPDTFRKYVAYAKRNCIPVLTDQAHAAFAEYYEQVRGLAGTDKPVPITARQLEGLIRLGEASARIRLSPTVDESDAKRAITIVDSCLRQIAYDAKTGMFDIDAVITSQSKSARDILSALTQTIRDNMDVFNRAPEDTVLATLTTQGHKLEDVLRYIEKLEKSGNLMRPKEGFLRII